MFFLPVAFLQNVKISDYFDAKTRKMWFLTADPKLQKTFCSGCSVMLFLQSANEIVISSKSYSTMPTGCNKQLL